MEKKRTLKEHWHNGIEARFVGCPDRVLYRFCQSMRCDSCQREHFYNLGICELDENENITESYGMLFDSLEDAMYEARMQLPIAAVTYSLWSDRKENAVTGSMPEVTDVYDRELAVMHLFQNGDK